MNNCDPIVAKTLSVAYPFILLFGFYIILNGHITPGGGFQGGAVLAAIFIIRYLITPEKNIDLKRLQIIEKVLYLCIMLLPILLIFNQMLAFDWMKQFYLVSMNTLIGIKVCCGLTIIFYRFVLFESR
ncbi:MnhB domain-containing protein [Vallitalea okinawensis]|uniref:MnhB domain-containing protein n=1 Tax=Vallitalea okinawensis TaxID=2078660 RepID=UPI000CFCB486|nr:MnhB domain-containing protein [Vallitalea okinawensis]